MDKGFVPFGFGRGNARFLLGARRVARGEDPATDLDGAIADYTAAIDLRPGSREAWSNRGIARITWARYRVEHGKNADALYADGIRDIDRVIEIAPAHPVGPSARGNARLSWALALAAPGDDPAPLSRDAIAFRPRPRGSTRLAGCPRRRRPDCASTGAFTVNHGAGRRPGGRGDAVLRHGPTGPARSAPWLWRTSPQCRRGAPAEDRRPPTNRRSRPATVAARPDRLRGGNPARRARANWATAVRLGADAEPLRRRRGDLLRPAPRRAT